MFFETIRINAFMRSLMANFRTLFRSMGPSLGRMWAIASFVWQRLPQFVLVVFSAFTFSVIAIIVYKGLTSRTITIQPISVPKQLAESGYTPDVASQRLRAELLKVQAKPSLIRISKLLPALALSSETPNFVIPTVGLSVDTIVSSFHTFVFSDRRQTVSGEFTIVGGQLWLRLRINGQDLYSSEKGVDLDRPDELLSAAAQVGLFLESKAPYDAALWRHKTNESEALAIAERNVIRLPTSDRAVLYLLIFMGAICRDQGDYSSALKHLERAIALDPKDAYAHFNIAEVYYSKNERERAKDEWLKAIDLDSSFAEAHNNLGWALIGENKLDEAVARFTTALELDPKLPMAYRNWGVVLGRKGDRDGAISKYKRAIDADPQFWLAHEDLGDIMVRSDPDEAIREYRMAVELMPGALESHTKLVAALVQKNRLDEAIGEYRRFLSVKPNDAAAHTDFGLLLYGKGDVESAIAEYQKAIALDPGNVKARENLEFISRMKEPDKAISADRK